MSAPEQDTDILPTQDPLSALKARADMLGVKYHPSISFEKLRDKVNAVLDDKPEPEADASPVAAKSSAQAETAEQRRVRKVREASELVRIRVTCMNPAKTEWDGEIFTAANSVVGTFKKYVPFNADEGWHVPRILYNQIRDRQCQVFVTVRNERGNSSRKGKLIKEFAVEVLPPLTQDEIDELARRQAMAHAID